MSRTVIIGVGNEFRRDDAAGLHAARALRARLPDIEVHELDGEPTDLIEAWTGASTAYVIDAVASDATDGTVHRLEIAAHGAPQVPAGRGHSSSHVLGVGEAVALGRALDRLPDRLVLIGISGASFDTGVGLSAPVAAAVRDVVDDVAAAEVTA
jgi:hydrogenase maturation protease